jgi:proteasome activator subunit 4
MDTPQYDCHTSTAHGDQQGRVFHFEDMGDHDCLSVAETPNEPDDADASTADKHRVWIQTYLGSLPYVCESIDEMQAKLEDIVGKIAVCAHVKDWLTLNAWDSKLQL